MGCCGFPVSRKKYYDEFKTVEVQQTFYDPPSVETLKRWRQEAPPDFEFTVKAWQVITHPPGSPTYRRLKRPFGNPENYGSFRNTEEVLTAWEVTLQAVRQLRAKVVLFQTPRSFRDTEENIRNVMEFFKEVSSHGVLVAFEPRGWQRDSVLKVSKGLPVIHVVDPFQDSPVTEGTFYFRLHGIGGYRYRYTGDDLLRLAEIVAGYEGGYVFFNNISMFEDAKRFRQTLPRG